MNVCGAFGRLAAPLLALGFASGAGAQSSVTLYGLLDVSAGSFQSAGTARIKGVANGSLSTSFVGFKGSEDLGGGLRAEFALEQFLRADTGASGRFNGDAFYARNAFVGLQGGLGSLRLGRNTTLLFVSTLLFNAFGDSFGISPAIRQVFTPNFGQAFLGDSGWNNSVWYGSPRLGGLTLNALVNAGEGASGANGSNLSAGALYFSGPLGATVAWQRVRNGAFAAPAGWRDQETVQVGASYNFGAAKLFGQFTRVSTTASVNTDADISGIGVSVPLAGGRIVAQYGRATADLGALKNTSQTTSAGYLYDLSKRTELYGVLMNDRLSARSSGNTIAAGMRHRF